MSYRHYFYKIDKDTLEKIHNFTKEEFQKWALEKRITDSENDPYIPIYKIGKNFHEFGKYYENTKEIQEKGMPLFKNKELSDMYEEYEPFIVGKEAVLNAIEFQKNLIIRYYENMLYLTDEERFEKNLDERTKEKMYQQHIESMYKEWKNTFMKNGCFAIDLNESNEAITTSWKYEYSIFELVRLYKSTDWEKYGLIFMGW